MASSSLVGALGRDPAAVEEHAPGRPARWSTPGGRPRAVVVASSSRSPSRISARRRVDRRGGVVEDQHAGLAQQGPGQGDPLALAARQGHAALADHVAMPSGSSLDEPLGPGHARWRGAPRRCRRPGPGRRSPTACRRTGTSPGTPGRRRGAARRDRPRRRSTPPRRTAPSVGSARRTSSSHSVVLPAPVEPDEGHDLARRRRGTSGRRAPAGRLVANDDVVERPRRGGPAGSGTRVRPGSGAGAGARPGPGRGGRSRRRRGAAPRGRSPTTCIGKARMLNRAMPCTRSPVVMRPSEICHEPRASSAMMPTVGMACEHRLERSPGAGRRRCGWSAARSAAARSRSISCVAAAERLHDERAVEALVHDPRDGADLAPAPARPGARRAWCRPG